MRDSLTVAVASLRDVRREAERGALYAVLDACDEPRVLTKVRELGPTNAASLYRGRAEDDLAAIAPYLARVSPAMLDWIGQTFWTDPWGIFAVYDGDLESLRTHLRKFLLVTAPNGDSWYFRFYDPRVLSKFLPTCDDAQLDEIFGSVGAYGWVDLDTYGVALVKSRRVQAAREKPRIVVTPS
jgi:hypothetical protein